MEAFDGWVLPGGGAVQARDARRSFSERSGCDAYAAKPLALRWHAYV
ncbi:hypothetical protein ACIQW5_28855 [Methylorubrum thiocyanatum]